MAFAGHSLCLAGKPVVSKADLEGKISALGASLKDKLSKSTCVLICSVEEFVIQGKKVTTAVKDGIPIVCESWLDACISTKATKDLALSQNFLKNHLSATQQVAVGNASSAPAPGKQSKGADAGKKKKRTQDSPPPSPPPSKKAAPAVQEFKTKPTAASKTNEESAAAAGSGKVDPSCKVDGASLVPSFDCMLNQTNIGENNNKFYQIQLCANHQGHFVFTRWGRVGAPGSTQVQGPVDLEKGQTEFKKVFKSKTGNDWDNRANFTKKDGKYGLVEMDATRPVPVPRPQAAPKAPVVTAPCSMDPCTQEFVEWILDKDMFCSAMAKFDLDINKMPLGSISKAQVQKGFDVLSEIDQALRTGASASVLQALSGKFYTTVPHAFGMRRPPVIDNIELLRSKFDMVAVLGDIEIAQTLQEDTDSSGKHPTDIKYEQLEAKLAHLDKNSKMFKIISKYAEATGNGQQLLDVWEVDRNGEASRFDHHKDLGNRKLLWHGTNIAVVAAILKTGLRIMPTATSGSRVGRGIYLASEHSKSAGYVRPGAVKGQQHGILFLCEAALGNMFVLTQDDGSLIQAPKGYDSVHAKGRQEPDPSRDVKVKLDSKDVIVPQGKPHEKSGTPNTSFAQSEYLVYKESQQRLRYICRFKF